MALHHARSFHPKLAVLTAGASDIEAMWVPRVGARSFLTTMTERRHACCT